MIQIFHSNLAVVDLVKRPLEQPKNVSLCPNFYRREGEWEDREREGGSDGRE